MPTKSGIARGKQGRVRARELARQGRISARELARNNGQRRFKKRLEGTSPGSIHVQLDAAVMPLFRKLKSYKPEAYAARQRIRNEIALASQKVISRTADLVWAKVDGDLGKKVSPAIYKTDLAQLGFEKALRYVIPKYRPDGGSKYSSYLINSLRRSLNDALAREHPALRRPTRYNSILERVFVLNLFIAEKRRPPKNTKNSQIFLMQEGKNKEGELLKKFQFRLKNKYLL
ncbi:MAG: hypothetical protein ABIH20_00980 [Candidatus Diapherotrites archaeon]